MKKKKGFGGVVGDDLGDLVGMLVFSFFFASDGFNDVVGAMRRWPEVVYSTMVMAGNFHIHRLRRFPGVGGSAGPVGQRFWSWWDSSCHARWLRWLALEEDNGWKKLRCCLDIVLLCTVAANNNINF